MRRGVRVLLIDDEPDSIRLIELVLRAEGCEVVLANSATQALEAMGTFSPEVVIADHNMPGITGETLLDQVGEMAPHTQRLMLTADPRMRNEDGRPYRVMHKPFRIDALRAEVDRLTTPAAP